MNWWLKLFILKVSIMKFSSFFAISHSWFIEQIKNARPDLTVLKEYKQREQEFFNRAKDLELITAERDAQKAKYDGLRKQRLDEFMSGFNLISLKLKEMYQVCLNGIWRYLAVIWCLTVFRWSL